MSKFENDEPTDEQLKVLGKVTVRTDNWNIIKCRNCNHTIDITKVKFYSGDIACPRCGQLN